MTAIFQVFFIIGGISLCNLFAVYYMLPKIFGISIYDFFLQGWLSGQSELDVAMAEKLASLSTSTINVSLLIFLAYLEYLYVKKVLKNRRNYK